MQTHLCNFSAEWLTDHTQSNVKSCKIGLRQKFIFEVITTKLSHQMSPYFWQVVAKTCGISDLNARYFVFGNFKRIQINNYCYFPCKNFQIHKDITSQEVHSFLSLWMSLKVCQCSTDYCKFTISVLHLLPFCKDATTLLSV